MTQEYNIDTFSLSLIVDGVPGFGAAGYLASNADFANVSADKAAKGELLKNKYEIFMIVSMQHILPNPATSFSKILF